VNDKKDELQAASIPVPRT